MKRAAKLMFAIMAVLIFLATGHVYAENIKIGFSLPLTGDFAFMGHGVRDATILGKESMGKTKNTYEFIFEDCKYDSKIDATIGNKFVSMDKVDIIVSLGGGSGGVLAPLADQNGIIHFAITSTPTVTEGDLNFAHWTPVPSMNDALVGEIKKRGFKRLAVFTNIDLNDVMAIHNDLKTKLDYVDVEEVHKGQQDYRMQIAKMKQADPDLIVLLTKLPDIDILLKQLREQGMDKVRLTTIEFFEMAKEKSLIEGEFYVSSATPTSKFAEEFKARTGMEPTIGSPHAYDVIRMIITAAENVKGKPTPKAIAAEINKLKNFPGVLGPLTMREDGRVLSNPNVKMIKDGKVVRID